MYLSESPSNYSPTPSEFEDSLGDFQLDRDDCMTGNLQLSPTPSNNATEIDEPGSHSHSPVMLSKRAHRNQSQTSRKKRIEEQKKSN